MRLRNIYLGKHLSRWLAFRPSHFDWLDDLLFKETP